MKALVTSAGTGSGLALIQWMRRSPRGIHVVAADINPYGQTAGSLLADEFYRAPFGDEDAFVPYIVELATDEDIDLIVPINDSEVEALASCLSELPEGCVCLVPTPEVVSLVRDKARMTERAAALGVSCPERLDPACGQKRIVRDVFGLGSRGIRIVDGAMDEDLVRRVDSGEAFVQEVVEGAEYTVDVLCDRKGDPVYVVPRERVEVKSGVCTKGRITNNARLIDCARVIAADLRIPGFSNIQFIVDKDDAPRFIEVNPRFGAGSACTLKAAPRMFERFLDIVQNGWESEGADINEDSICWGAFVTRYYSEVLYEG